MTSPRLEAAAASIRTEAEVRASRLAGLFTPEQESAIRKIVREEVMELLSAPPSQALGQALQGAIVRAVRAAQQTRQLGGPRG